MKRIVVPIAVALLAAVKLPEADAQQAAMHRLPSDQLDVAAPSARIGGEPGRFVIRQRVCAEYLSEDLRRRIVDIAVQEWAYFGFSVLDETDPENWVRRGPAAREPSVDLAMLREQARQRAAEAERVADSIAGYWAVTAEGSWVIERQNEAWLASGGSLSRWVQPWSAAFISWVMCEAGLTSPGQFRRAVAHHVYIDQAIRARDGNEPDAVYRAYEIGEREILPGDLLCAARRPAYRTLAQRRPQMGNGARTHCDIVVKVDQENEVLLAIGGNVRGTVGLKLLPAELREDGSLQPIDRSSVPGARSAFAHLSLQADGIEHAAFDGAPTVVALACSLGNGAGIRMLPAAVPVVEAAAVRC